MRRGIVAALVVFLAVSVGLLVYGSRGDAFFQEPPWARIIPSGDVAPVARPSFQKHVLPIFEQYCIDCHGSSDAHNGLRLDTYEGLMRGTQYGPVVYPGQPSLSNLLALVKHETSPQIWMPYHRDPLSKGRIKTIENWIKLGAPNN